MRRMCTVSQISLEDLEQRANETNFLPDENFKYPFDGEKIPMKKHPKRGYNMIDHSRFEALHKSSYYSTKATIAAASVHKDL